MQYGGNSGVDAFKRAMYTSTQDKIMFSCLNDPDEGDYCTANSPSGAFMGTIECLNDVILTEHTFVHELGHVFRSKTGGTETGVTFYGLFQFPPFSNSAIVDNSGLVVMGKRNIPITLTPGITTTRPDWLRGRRGWGSAVASPVPCDFQINPYALEEWRPIATGVSPAEVAVLTRTEIDETAADAFLNWVYTKTINDGYKNANWSGINDCSNLTGLPQLTERPGDARANFMNAIVMPTLATYVLTPTP